jgi:hypothetical protein
MARLYAVFNTMCKETGMKKLRVWLLGIAVLSMVLSCASGGRGPSPSQKTELLDDKGAALGISTPEWVFTYQTGGNIAVEAMPEYKDYYCFVIYATSPDKQFLLAWVNNLNGPMAIAQVISSVVSQDVAGKAGYIEGAEQERIVRTNAEMMGNASYTGARKVADWWLLSRNQATKAEEYQAFALYIFDRKLLNDQIARNLQNIANNNAAMSEAEQAIYADQINEIRTNGFSNR